MIARWMIVGFVLWLLVTAPFRFLPATAMTPGAQHITLLFLIVPAVLFGMTYLALQTLKVDPSDRGEAAAIFAVPGLLVGIYQVSNFGAVFPNLDAGFAPTFSALLFACYAAIVLSGLLFSRIHQIENKA